MLHIAMVMSFFKEHNATLCHLVSTLCEHAEAELHKPLLHICLPHRFKLQPS